MKIEAISPYDGIIRIRFIGYNLSCKAPLSKIVANLHKIFEFHANE